MGCRQPPWRRLHLAPGRQDEEEIGKGSRTAENNNAGKIPCAAQTVNGEFLGGSLVRKM
jgi:hypothetical protein